MENILLKYKHARMMLALRDARRQWCTSSLAKETGSTYVHTLNFVSACEAIGIVTKERHGKEKVIRLTEKGSRVAEMVAGVYAELAVPHPQMPTGQIPGKLG